MIDEKLAAVYVTVIEKEIKHKKIINTLHDWLISRRKKQEAEDSTSETQTANTRYAYTTDGLQLLSELDPALYFSTIDRFNTNETER